MQFASQGVSSGRGDLRVVDRWTARSASAKPTPAKRRRALVHTVAVKTPGTAGWIVLAAYRPAPQLFERQIASIAGQTLTDFRCLVGLDGRDSDTLARARRLVSGDARFEVREYETNLGFYHHFERLLRAVPTSAPWVALSDQDDFWYPTRLDQLVAPLADPSVSASTGQARVVTADGRVVRENTSRRAAGLADLFLQNEVTGSLAVFRRDVVEHALPFPICESKAAYHDHWLGVCAAALGEIRVLPDPVQDYVQHSSNVVGESAATTVSSWRSQVQEAGGPRAYFEARAALRGEWRCAMSKSLADRGLGQVAVPGGTFPGGLRQTAASIVRAVGRRRMRVRGGVDALVQAFVWARAHR